MSATVLYLTPEAIQARRLELVEVDAQIRALGRRKSVLRAEILSGYAAPVKGAPAEQLPLVETVTATTVTTPAAVAPEAPTQAPEATKPATTTTPAMPLRERVRAALGAAKGRRSAKVLALLLGESEEDVADELRALELLREVIGKNTSDKAGRAYELRNRWEAKRGKDRNAKPEKVAKKGAEAPVLGAMTMGQVRQVLLDEIYTWKRWHSGAAADHALWAELRKSGHDRDDLFDQFDLGRHADKVGHEALTALAKEGRIQCSEGPGNWNNSYAPLGVERTAEGGPDEPRPPRAKKASKKPATKKVAGPGKKAHAKAEKPSKKPATKKAKSPFLGKPLPESYLAGLATDIAAHMRQAGKDRLHINDLVKALSKTPAHIETAVIHGGGPLALRRERLTPTGSLQKLVYLGEEPRPEPLPVTAPTPQASRQELIRDAVLAELKHSVATFGELLTNSMRAFVGMGQGMPQPNDLRDVLKALCEEGKVVWDETKKVYRLPPPPPEPKKAKAKKAPSPPPPTLPVKDAMAKVLEDFSIDQWAQARAEVCEKIAQKKGVSVAVGPLLLSLTCESILLGPVLELLDAAGAVTVGYRGKTPAVVTPGAKVGDKEIAHDLQALTRRYVLDLVDDRADPPTTDDLAADLELPHALIASVLLELHKDQSVLCMGGRWMPRSSKPSAQERTAPLFDDVEPAPAVDGLEPEGDET